MPDEPDPLLQQARLHVKQREFPQAAALFQQVLAKDKSCIAAYEGLAAVSFMQQDYAGAIQHYRKISTLDPRQAFPLVNIGAAQNRLAQHQNAIKSLRGALAKDRKCAEAYYNLGLAHRGLNQLSMAVSAYKEAIRLSPEMAEAYQNLGNVYTEMGNMQQAVLNFRRALEIRPGFERAKLGLDKALSAAEDAKNAISPFGRLVGKEGGAAVGDGRLRDLSPQERFEDRTTVQQHARDIEKAASVALQQIRQELEQSLMHVAHAFSGDDSHSLSQHYTAFVRARTGFSQTMRLLRDRCDTLRRHEAMMRADAEK